MRDTVSRYAGALTPAPSGAVTWQAVLEEIRAGKHKELIEKARSIQDREEYRAFKQKRLPAVTFSGTFNGRRHKDAVLQPTGIITADMDHIEDVDRTFDLLRRDPRILFLFRSPGGDGIKAGIRAEGITNDQDHKRLFSAVERYFEQVYGIRIDPSCKDISRLTFVSHDPAAYVNESAALFDIEAWEQRPPFETPKYEYSGDARGPLLYAQKVLKSCCDRIRQSQPGEQHHVRLAMARTVGGYLHYGLQEGEVLQALEAAVIDSGAKDIRSAMKTVQDGLEDGKAHPIYLQERPDPHSDTGTDSPKDPPKGQKLEFINLESWRAFEAFQGEPPIREYIVDGVIPKGQPSLFAAAGGLGKSMAMLHLCHDVAAGSATFPDPPLHLGGRLCAEGQAVYLSFEDDSIEIHSRLHAFGQIPRNLIAIPVPSAGGVKPFFKLDGNTREPAATPYWYSFFEQCLKIFGLTLIVIDPLQTVCFLDLNQPEHAQAICSHIAALASETGAAVVLTHHFRKSAVETPDQARQAVRGSAGLVDGVRSVYAMWTPPETKEAGNPRALCRYLGIPYTYGIIAKGAVVKANGRASTRVSTFARSNSGLFIDRTDDLRDLVNPHDVKDMLLDAVASAALNGYPFTKTGKNGLYERRNELPEPLCYMSKNRLPELADDLLQKKELVLARAKGSSSMQWLDAPEGPFARGVGELEQGAMKS